MKSRSLVLATISACATVAVFAGTAMPAQAASSSSATPTPVSVADQSGIEQAVRSAVTLRNDQSVSGASKAPLVQTRTASVFAPEAVTAESAELAQLQQQRALYAQYGEKFTSYTTTLSFGPITEVNGTATAPFEEVTMAKRTPDAAGQARPDYGYDFNQTATLSEVNGQWRLTSLSHQATEDLPETVLPGAAVLQARASGTLQKIATERLNKAASARTMVQPMWTGIANRSKVVQYASTYWQQHNTAYRSLSDDCTNFASQALFAAGWPEVQTGNYNDPSQWFYDVYNQSYAWEGAQFLADFGGRYTTRFHADVAGPVWTAGDIVFWIWNQNTTVRYDHTTIVTFVDSSGSPYFTEHTNDHYNKSYAAMILGEPAPYVADMHD